MLAVLQVSLAALIGPLADTVPVPAPAAVIEAPSLAPTMEALAPTTFQDARFDPAITGVFADTTRRHSIEYSNGYYVRLKIHKYASWTMLPLNWHGVFAGATAALFAVNTVTGVWNLIESRHDPAGRTRRWVHSIAMFVASAGFVATGATAPEMENGEVGDGGNASTHKALAITSMSIATASWLMMLIWKE